MKIQKMSYAYTLIGALDSKTIRATVNGQRSTRKSHALRCALRVAL
jgi:hypothetical protein